jgi:hypothetical protein
MPAAAEPEPPLPPAETIEIEPTILVEPTAIVDPQPVSEPDVPEPAATEPQIAEADAIDFGMVDPGHPEPSAPAAPPDSSFGFEVDLGAAADIPVATSVGETGDFGVVDLPDDAPFRGAEEVKPAGIELASDPVAGAIDLHAPFELESFDAPADATQETPATEEPAEEPPPPKLELVRDDEPIDAIELVDTDTTVIIDEPPAPPPAATMPRRSTPVVFNFDLSVDDAPRSPTPRESFASHSEPETGAGQVDEPDLAVAPVDAVADVEAIDVREMPTPVIQPVVETYATETMAELYVKQGLRHEAIGVYKQLIDARPNDQALRDRLAELEGNGRAAAGSSAREFFSALSRRTSAKRPSGSHTLPDSSPPRGSLDRLFDSASVARHDQSAAESLSAAFGAGPAEQEESPLDRVFNTRPARPPGR